MVGILPANTRFTRNFDGDRGTVSSDGIVEEGDA
jgi:hypothetical protein